MTASRFILTVLLAASPAIGQQNSSQQPPSPRLDGIPASCPVTVRPAHEFTPPAPFQRDKGDFWLGTDKLWTNLGEPMIWQWAPHQPGHEREVQPLTAKIFWFRVGYDWHTELQPYLTITGKRLDGPAPPLMVMTWQRPDGSLAQATNAIMGNTAAMLTGVYVPIPGCWEITGDYKGDKLSFVVWVTPLKQPNQ